MIQNDPTITLECDNCHTATLTVELNFVFRRGNNRRGTWELPGLTDKQRHAGWAEYRDSEYHHVHLCPNCAKTHWANLSGQEAEANYYL